MAIIEYSQCPLCRGTGSGEDGSRCEACSGTGKDSKIRHGRRRGRTLASNTILATIPNREDLQNGNKMGVQIRLLRATLRGRVARPAL